MVGGIVFTLMSMGGMSAGRLPRARFGRYVEILGGLAPVGIGASMPADPLQGMRRDDAS